MTKQKIWILVAIVIVLIAAGTTLFLLMNKKGVPNQNPGETNPPPPPTETSSTPSTPPPPTSGTSFGKGIFAHVRAGGRTKESAATIETLVKNPSIAGSQLSYDWGELEPTEGNYRWDIIENDLAVWATQGKKCWIEIASASRRATGSKANLGTPSWVFTHAVPTVGNANTVTYPVFWDKTYQSLWTRFIRAFAAKYDGDPRIEFISTGGYGSDHEPNLVSDDNDILMSQWQAAGFDGFTVSGVYLNQAIKPILKMYSDTFKKTPIGQTIHVQTDFDNAMNQYAAGLHFILISNGFSYKVGTQSARQEWRTRHDTLNTKVGYAEWGPAGRGTKNGATQKLIDVYKGALGDDNDPLLSPASRLSYLPLGDWLSSVETQAEWQAALDYAAAHLYTN